MLTLDEADKLLMIPGPTPVQREILTAIAEPTISHTSRPMADIVERCLEGLRAIAQTERGRVFVFGGSGTLAQEAAVVNLVAPGERLLVVSNGFFGDRFVPIAEAHGITVERLAASWGESVTGEQLEERLAAGKVRAVALTHVDTSTGVCAPVRELAGIARRRGALVIVDAVCSFGGAPLAMDEWGIDVVLTGAQKALGVPPGLTILAVSEEAWQRRRALPRVTSYYADLLNWEASMADPQVYFSTHAVNLFYALRAAIEIILGEGLNERYDRHERLARGFRAGAEAIGLSSLTGWRYLAPTMSVLAYPTDVPDERFRSELGRRGVVAAGCLGEFKGRGVRFGHMGNIDQAEIVQTIAAIEDTLLALGRDIEPGAGLAAAQRAMSRSAVAG
jgi:aspartate aminotransferase-like enzyme